MVPIKCLATILLVLPSLAYILCDHPHSSGIYGNFPIITLVAMGWPTSVCAGVWEMLVDQVYYEICDGICQM